MGLQDSQKDSIADILKSALRNKFRNYNNSEPSFMPFHTRLLGKDRLALFSFIHSLNTNFGTTIFEPIAAHLAQNSFTEVKRQSAAGNSYISEEAEREIQTIIDNLRAAALEPNKDEELQKLRMVCRKGKMKKIKATRVDLYVKNASGELYLFDIKTAKPNKGSFIEFKRTLLEWAACVLSENPEAKVNTLIAIPYNPYEPKPYSRWTMKGMLDLEEELKVAEEFWDFLGGRGAYNDLLDIFEKVGIEMREEIDEYFARFRK